MIRFSQLIRAMVCGNDRRNCVEVVPHVKHNSWTLWPFGAVCVMPVNQRSSGSIDHKHDLLVAFIVGIKSSLELHVEITKTLFFLGTSSISRRSNQTFLAPSFVFL